ncbi:MAG: lipocalin-like domain-containing protein [Burkholderiales bacterium]
MNRYVYALTLTLLAPSLCFAQQSLVGTYRLVSLELLVDGKPTLGTVGPNPHGYLFVTPQAYMQTYTGANRKFGTSVEEKAALWDTLNFWGGPYQVEGNKLTVSVDVSWNQSWTGKPQVRTIKFEGKRLVLVAAPQPFPRDPSKTVVSTLVWERID